jgi:pyrroloquinoline quinone biosynthesis protein E
VAEIEALKAQHAGRIVVDHVRPDYHARYPKACMGGWAQKTLNVTPAGKVLPCHAAETLPGLAFLTVRDASLHEIWYGSPAFNAYRGLDWMQEPCRSCPRKAVDFGGCRCQAFALTGDARNTDPVCVLSPNHDVVVEAGAVEETGTLPDYIYREMPDRAPA